MNRNRATLVSLVVAILVGIGALLCSFVSHLAVLAGISALPRSLVLQDPLGWALRPGVPPLAILGMLLVLVLLVGLTWLFVRLVVKAALPGRGAAVFFGTWGALIVAAVVAGIVRAVVMMATLRIPSDNTELYVAQFQQFSFVAATWALMWGWIVALVAALIHRSGGQPCGDTTGGVRAAAWTGAVPRAAAVRRAAIPAAVPAAASAVGAGTAAARAAAVPVTAARTAAVLAQQHEVPASQPIDAHQSVAPPRGSDAAEPR